MNVLYGIQGTGHGHISRARELLPVLKEVAEIDILISGYNCRLSLEGFNIIRKRGLSFEYDSDGNVDMFKTATSLRPLEFLRDLQGLKLDTYDLIISDFEPVTAWAATLQNRPVVALSHQAAFLSQKSPRPEQRSLFAEQVMTHFAPSTHAIGFHFKRYDSFIEPPIIRKQIRDLTPVQGEHVTVYLPAYHHEILMEQLKPFGQVRWEIFSAYAESKMEKGHITVQPISNEQFLKSFEGALGVMTSGGFETCAEAMYMDKKLLIKPIQNQYEQLCNAAALKELGIPVIHDWSDASRQTIDSWLQESGSVHLPEYADAESIIDRALEHARVMNVA